ncbi:hypothetical protein Tco_0724297, partial [Tanacetum coccineum]
LNDVMVELGYVNDDPIYYHCMILETDLEIGLRALGNDLDVLSSVVIEEFPSSSMIPKKGLLLKYHKPSSTPYVTPSPTTTVNPTPTSNTTTIVTPSPTPTCNPSPIVTLYPYSKGSLPRIVQMGERQISCKGQKDPMNATGTSTSQRSTNDAGGTRKRPSHIGTTPSTASTKKKHAATGSGQNRMTRAGSAAAKK